MLRIKRSKLILILIFFSLIFWYILYWNVVGIYSRRKNRLLSLSEGNLLLPDDDLPHKEIDQEQAATSEIGGYDEQYLRNLAKISTAQDQRNYDAGYHNHAFNEMLSKKLSFTRPLPDARPARCRKKEYPQNLPATSVIICFHNEAWSALLRTVHTVLARSPEHLIHEIILVDDFSDFAHLKTDLENYIEKLPKVKLVRTEERQGLIRARMLGAQAATGKTLLFLDSHCEVNIGWLEPLLKEIHDDPHTIAVPIMDVVDSDNFFYESSAIVRGGFNWGMHFQWEPLPKRESKMVLIKAEPFKSPTMAGGLFAMDKQYFHELGEYDEGMDIWGGENLELSFRVWQCGGKLVIVPCSHVGHIFRKRRPYGAPVQDSFTKNTLRLVHVWLDDYKKYYFHITPRAEDMQYGSITKRLELRKQLNCKSFQWYLENIYPEQLEKLPDLSRSQRANPFDHKVDMPAKAPVVASGRLKHYASGLCVVSEKTIYDKRALLKLDMCKAEAGDAQLWYETEQKDFRLANLLCLDFFRDEGPYARLMKCMGSTSQSWIWTKKGSQQQLLNYGSAECLIATGVEPGALLKTVSCSSDSPLTYFELTKY